MIFNRLRLRLIILVFACGATSACDVGSPYYYGGYPSPGAYSYSGYGAYPYAGGYGYNPYAAYYPWYSGADIDVGEGYGHGGWYGRGWGGGWGEHGGFRGGNFGRGGGYGHGGGGHH